jgi:hypothetical protein
VQVALTATVAPEQVSVSEKFVASLRVTPEMTAAALPVLVMVKTFAGEVDPTTVSASVSEVLSGVRVAIPTALAEKESKSTVSEVVTRPPPESIPTVVGETV